MNTKNVVNQLKSQYPGKPIIKNSKVEPTEILCEIEPTKEHPGIQFGNFGNRQKYSSLP